MTVRAKPTPLVVVAEDLDDEALRRLAERCRVARATCSEELTDALAEADALVVRTYTKVDRALLERAPRLRVVGRAGTGLDNVDVAACRARGIEVVYAPEANTQAVVEYTIALIGEALRPRRPLDQPLGAEAWRSLRQGAVGREFAEITLGLLGFGRIGKGVACAAGLLGMRVIYNDLLEMDPDARHGATPRALHALFAESDVVSVHVDGRTSNRGFVSPALLEAMKIDAILLNTSRGWVVDIPALAALLRARPRSFAILDVHDPEPFGSDYPLLGLANARLYAHLAGRTHRALAGMSDVVRDVIAVLEGSAPRWRAPDAT